MARTFDIRFARSDGIAALLETPLNTFRWRGAGSLRIDGSRLDIERKRGIHTLLARRTHFRIHAADLREVAREGEALRIEFGVPGSRRGVLPIWVRNREEAAEIIRLMPTDRTVESDEPRVRAATPRKHHSPGVLLGVAFVSLIAGVIGTWLVGKGRSDDLPSGAMELSEPTTAVPMVPDVVDSPAKTRAITAPASPVAGTSRALSAGRASTSSSRATVPAEVVLWDEQEFMPLESATSAAVPVDASAMSPARVAYVDTNAETRRFLQEAMALRSAYLNGQADLEQKWWELSVRLYNSPAFDARPRSFLVDAELGLSLNWRASLANYRAALDSENRERIEAARADLARAGELTDELAYAFR